MVQKFKIYLFGDQIYDVHSKLRDLLHSANGPVLRHFFERVDYAIRAEIGQLSFSTRESFPRFSGIAHLLSWNRCDESFPIPFEMALTCIYQLGSFIKDHDNIDNSYPFPGEACALGLCTGTLTSAAISSCRSVSDLLPVAIQTVLIAFRTGLCVLDVRNRHKSSDNGSSSWSMVVGGSSSTAAIDALNAFRKHCKLPLVSQPYISAYGLHGLTISGPPSVLTQMCASEEFSGIKLKNISIQAPYHAPHLFCQEDIKDILRSTSVQTFGRYKAAIPVVSSVSERPVEASDYRSLLIASLEQILLEPINWELIKMALINVLRNIDSPTFKVIPYGTTAEQTIYSAISQESLSGLPTPAPAQDELISSLLPESHVGTGKKSKIAIIGMSGRFPDAPDNESFWRILEKGLDVHKKVPALHWDVKTHYDPTGEKKNTSATPWGCWLDNPAAFDARFFSMSPREAPQVDPAQRIALMTGYEAIEQAGIVPDATPSTRKDRVGIFYGVTSNDWMETNSAQNIDTYFIPGGNRAFIPGRLNYFFKFSGPSFSVDTACSSSLAAINIACNSLWKGDIDTAIAGGTNILTNPDFTAGLDRGHFLSRTGNCKTFDDEADGYCRGEGVGSVVLKRLEDALTDNDPIQAVILGAHTNHSAEAVSITRPHAGAQAEIFGKVLNESGIDPYSINYVEMHGTGTQAGDAGEMQSVLDTFAPKTGRRYRREDEVLYLGAAKANVGHGEAAAGVTSLAKVLLMMQHEIIPPHCGIKTKINHKFPTDLEERNVRIAHQPVSWKRADAKSQTRRVFLNNFSAAGGNSAILLEDAPLRITGHQEEDSRSCHIVAVSAKSAASLKGNLNSMVQFLDRNREISVGQLSYTTTARRVHHQHRIMVSGSSIQGILSQLKTGIDKQLGLTRAKSAPKVVFTFTGQGAQFPGMGKQLLQTISQFRADIHRLDQIGQSLGFPSIIPIFEVVSNDGGISDFAPIVVQLSSVCMQVALAKMWRSWGIVPDAVVGHSLGEYAALNVAGVLSDSDTVYLVGKRAELLQEMCTRNTHSMLFARASVETISQTLKGMNYEIACINSPSETVLSGARDEIKALEKVLESSGLKTTLLKIPYAFHSSQVEPILQDFQQIAMGVKFHKPSIPVLCPLFGDVIMEEGAFGPTYLSRHCREPVNMFGALQFARSSKIITDQTFTVEIGPHPAVAGMVKSTLGSQMVVLSTLQRGRDVWTTITEALKALYNAGMDFNWAEYHRDFKASHNVIQLPAYSWDLKEYWMQYVNDWSLRKGDPPLIINNTTTLESTTVHRTLRESPEGDNMTLIIESDIARPDLNPLVQGHVVNGVPLATPSIYADIALTMGKYLLDRYRPTIQERLVDVSKMVISKALIAKPQGPQPLQAHANVDWTKNSAELRFLTLDGNGLPTVEHASCTIQFTDRSQVEALAAKSNSIRSRMKALRKGIQEETAARFNRAMVYKMIHALAQFHQDYKAIDEVILNSDTLEASSKVSFGEVKKGGTFHTHPAFIDGLTQSGGFAMNCNDKADLDVEVFINHGWGSFQIFEEIAGDKNYTTYTQMKEGKNKMWNGDIAVFEGEKIVASFKDIVLQAVPRRVLFYILSVEAGQKPKANAQPPRETPAPALVTSQANAKAQPLLNPKTMERTAPKMADTAEPSIIPQAMQIVSQESGVAVSDLTDGSAFADMGIDSLLSLTIVARFREEMNMDIDSESLFIDCPTVKDLKDFLAPGQREDIQQIQESPENRKDNVPANEIPVAQEPSVPAAAAHFAPALQIIAQESGVAPDDLTDDSEFVDMGIDSLLSLIIVSRFREELGLDIESDSLFIDYPTLASLKEFMTAGSCHSSSSALTYANILDEKGTYDVQITPLSTSSNSSDGLPEFHIGNMESTVRQATSIILQGLPQNCQKTLFLFPDGSGSSTSYASLPRVDSSIAVVGLNSPYLKEPLLMRKVPLDELINGYLTEIRRRQPNGPYDIGGWSAGGILAYRAAQILCDQGEEVLSLILIDSPTPNGLDRLPQHFYDFCESLNLFGQSSGATTPAKPEWLIPHFNATIDVLHDYYAEPLLESQCPRVSIIWACDSIMDGEGVPKLPPHPDDTKGMRFLTEKRKDFSGNGWEELFPGIEIAIERIENATHFSMMASHPVLIKHK
ncbi:conidial yellow pigment biosynthesis polyketide synthase [Bisporella sp. PMI_857]|nr:conidial yellow pigment biosynthesis polyketide synthase [Bisporella sp. PMI_857]